MRLGQRGGLKERTLTERRDGCKRSGERGRIGRRGWRWWPREEDEIGEIVGQGGEGVAESTTMENWGYLVTSSGRVKGAGVSRAEVKNRWEEGTEKVEDKLKAR